jgi:histidinol-phosphate aminotransferase
MLNENPVPPSAKVVDAVTEIVKKGNRYPDRMYRLRSKLADLHGVKPENIALANGSSETIDAMMRIFMAPGDEFLLSDPTFEMFPSRAGLCGAKNVQIPLRESDLQYDVDGMLAAVNDNTKLILIINPNNPTGIFIADEDLAKFCELGIPLCVDEAYLDYHPDVAAKVDLIDKYPHVFLSHTLSKAYGLAGIRIGYVVGVPEVIEAFNRMFLPWNVSLMAMAAAEAILDNPGEVKEKVKYNNDWMDRFTEELKAAGLNPFPAHGNYMLIDATMTGKTTAEILQAGLDMEKLFLKSIKPIHGKNGYFRVTPGTVEENERFVRFVRTYF